MHPTPQPAVDHAADPQPDTSRPEWRAPAQGCNTVRAGGVREAAELLVKLHCIAPGLPFDVERVDGGEDVGECWRFVALQNGGATPAPEASRPPLGSVAAQAGAPASPIGVEAIIGSLAFDVAMLVGQGQASKDNVEQLKRDLIDAWESGGINAVRSCVGLARLEGELVRELRAEGEAAVSAQTSKRRSVEALKAEPNLLEAARQVHDEVKAKAAAGMRVQQDALFGELKAQAFRPPQPGEPSVADYIRASIERPEGQFGQLSVSKAVAPIGPDLELLRAAVVGCGVDTAHRSAGITLGDPFDIERARALGEACRLYLRAFETLEHFEVGSAIKPKAEVATGCVGIGVQVPHPLAVAREGLDARRQEALREFDAPANARATSRLTLMGETSDELSAARFEMRKAEVAAEDARRAIDKAQHLGDVVAVRELAPTHAAAARRLAEAQRREVDALRAWVDSRTPVSSS